MLTAESISLVLIFLLPINMIRFAVDVEATLSKEALILTVEVIVLISKNFILSFIHVFRKNQSKNLLDELFDAEDFAASFGLK